MKNSRSESPRRHLLTIPWQHLRRRISRNALVTACLCLGVCVSVFFLRLRHPGESISSDINRQWIYEKEVLLSQDSADGDGTTIHIAVVVCGNRFNDAVVTMKSALLFSANSLLHFHVFAEDSLHANFNDVLSRWRLATKTVEFSAYPICFPSGEDAIWRKLFKLCACQRLFIPALLDTIDSVIYLDTDVVFLDRVDSLWSNFARFNDSQVVAMAQESEDGATNWYRRFARHPFYEPFGLNSGVMLMNMTRMRALNWTQQLRPIYDQYCRNITWGDQDILNIVFHDHPEQVFLLSCDYNFRPDHCMYMPTCATAQHNGVRVLHGNRDFFHSNKQPAFRIVYDIYAEIEILSAGSSVLDLQEIKTKLINSLSVNLQTDLVKHSTCGANASIFLGRMLAEKVL